MQYSLWGTQGFAGTNFPCYGAWKVPSLKYEKDLLYINFAEYIGIILVKNLKFVLLVAWTPSKNKADLKGLQKGISSFIMCRGQILAFFKTLLKMQTAILPNN